MAILAQLIDDVVVHKFELNQPVIHVGREVNNDIQVDEAAVSAKHAVIEVQKSRYLDDVDEYFIKDLGSTNGTFVNETRVLDRQRLLNDDVVRVAWNSFKFIDTKGTGLDSTAHILQD